MDVTIQNPQSSSKNPTEDRRDTILRAAYEVFAQYGFKRTSMDDIAKAAGISRPALYQHFANKREIYRGLIDAHVAHVSTELSRLIGRDKPLGELLREMIGTAVIEPHRMLEDMPHGEELLGVNSQIAADLFDSWQNGKRDMFEEALAKHVRRDLAKDLAAVISLGTAGIKARGLSADAASQEADVLVSVVVTAAGKGQNSE